MNIQLGSKTTTVRLGGQRPMNPELAQQMLQEGERLMNLSQAIDNTSVDSEPKRGEVLFREESIAQHPTVFHATYSGDRYDGKLEMNSDDRSAHLNRTYEFNRNDGDDQVVITQNVPTFHKQEMDVYRIKDGGLSGTVERVVVD